MEPIDALPAWLQFWSSLGVGFMLLILIAIILSFFLPFFVYGTYNQTKRVNKNLKTVINLLQTHDDRLKLRESDPDSIFYKGKT